MRKRFYTVIEKALELGGYKEDQILTGINGGTKVTTGLVSCSHPVPCRYCNKKL